MSYKKKTWKNRQSEYPTRRKLVATGAANEYDVVRAEGAVSQEGDPFNAATMNDLESRVAEGLATEQWIATPKSSSPQPQPGRS